ncbi:GNAT family N-acetyltransferase [Alkalibacter mobilis]|uniref:GNAT family N-acetyltransferase n=1 Tax=Alkalibacter mobilis TaxID=2787712 RepID=UPI00189E5132|nr:GNAT family N-acetyltransferase [Alkalibacter mobilis]MBF7096254.1 GNAT family N-acetyltransferase [Alkalibacter mobilis]
MNIRKAVFEDISEIKKIYEHAVRYMRKNNNPDQWKDGYPGIEIIKEDIKNEKSYLCVENNEILGVFYFALGEEDPTYKEIYQGSWINDEPYGVIHRIATIKNKRGVAGFCVDYCFGKCQNLRIDTHKDNLPMRRFLAKKGFVECGIIHIADGSERIAYQKCE